MHSGDKMYHHVSSSTENEFRITRTFQDLVIMNQRLALDDYLQGQLSDNHLHSLCGEKSKEMLFLSHTIKIG